jgi:phage baseplate assembly protein W
MATTNVTRQYKDLDLNFTIHPLRKDVNKNLDEVAIVNSIKNIVSTNHYEKPFQPDFGSNVRRMLFESLDNITASALEREIQQSITNYEPRVKLLSVKVIPDFDNNGFNVEMQFYILNKSEPVTITFLLERLR